MNILAALVLVTATNLHGSIFPECWKKELSLYIPFSQTCRKTLPKAKLEECIGVCFERFLIKTTQVLTPYI